MPLVCALALSPREMFGERAKPETKGNASAQKLLTMSWIDSTERRLGHLAIPHLLRYVALLNGLAFVLCQIKPGFEKMLEMDPTLVMQGQVWRLFSHVFVPSLGGVFPTWITAVFYLMFLVWLGDGLEQAMGVFRLNLYYLIGVIGTNVAAFLSGQSVGGFFLNNTLVFAFAAFYPELKVLFFFVIPVKIKWLAWLDAFLLVLSFLLSDWGYRAGVIAALTNFFVFFGPSWIQSRKRRKAQEERRSAYLESADGAETLHSCHLCGRTEVTAPEMEFRIARDGNEYCRAHLPGSGV
ncbi:MAG: hypothetical protein DVB28_000483 [Verrucomicrobia bacterium]|nr:MAG: hypothetical protein DVB28_000483 [Verrucomicrobiota bacterium]